MAIADKVHPLMMLSEGILDVLKKESETKSLDSQTEKMYGFNIYTNEVR